MYAIIQTGGKQYRVGEGDLLRVEKLAGEPGRQVAFDDVLLVGDSEAAAVGNPTVEGARVLATVVRQGRGDKILVFKFKRRKMYRRKNGHRQSFTEVRIDRLETAGGAADTAKTAKAPRKSAPEAETGPTAAQAEVKAKSSKPAEVKEAAAKAGPDKKAGAADKKAAAKAGAKKTAAKAEAKASDARAGTGEGAAKAAGKSAAKKPEPPSDGE